MMNKEAIQNTDWYDLTEKEMYSIKDLEKKKKYLKLYRFMWIHVISRLSELLGCNLNIEGRITIKNVVTQYREALYLLGISKEEQDNYIREKYIQWKK